MPDARRARPAGDELARVFDETVALYHRLTADAATLHRSGPMSGPRRTVLVALARSGPQTVARLARARAQSRQRLQPLVNGLVADGLVEARPNPQHRQSHLMALTPRGERAVSRILETERAFRGALDLATPPRSLARAADVLREVRRTLEDQVPRIAARMARRHRR